MRQLQRSRSLFTKQSSRLPNAAVSVSTRGLRHCGSPAIQAAIDRAVARAPCCPLNVDLAPAAVLGNVASERPWAQANTPMTG